MSLLVSLGKRIRALRSEKGWSQEQLAFECGLHRTYLGHVELGKKNISFNNLVTISAALGITLSELFAGLEAGTGAAPQSASELNSRNPKPLPFGKLPPEVNRLVTELRVQRVTMDRALTALNELIASPTKPAARPRSKKNS